MEKRIEYDRESKDWAMYIDGRYVGSAASPGDAQRRLDEMVTSALEHDARLTPVVVWDLAPELAPAEVA